MLLGEEEQKVWFCSAEAHWSFTFQWHGQTQILLSCG